MAFSFEYAELGARSAYSFLAGASHPEELVERAVALGYRGLALADRNGVYGSPRGHVAAKKKENFAFVVASEFSIVGAAEETYPLLLVETRDGYGNLCELSTEAHRFSVDAFAETPKTPRKRRKKMVGADDRAAFLSWEALAAKSDGLFCVLPVEGGDTVPLPLLQEAFGDRLRWCAAPRYDGTDRERFRLAAALEKRTGVPVIFSQRSSFHVPSRKPLHDVLTALRYRCRLEELGLRALPNAETALKSPEALYQLFPEAKRWLTATLPVAERCRFSLRELKYRYPDEWIPKGHTAQSFLEKCAREGAHQRYGKELPEKVTTLLQHEFALIEELEYADYFLTVSDIVAFARSQGILCQGRGAAANSLVCYVLGITAIDPAQMDLLFERFLSRERHEPPDIDVDFEHERREEVIQYIYRRYGRDRAAISAEVLCFRRKSAFRETAKVLGLSEAFVDKLLLRAHRRTLEDFTEEDLFATYDEVGTAEGAPRDDAMSDRLRRYWALAKALRGFPRHLGTHVGGFVLTADRLTRSVPVQPTAMPGRSIVQWDKYDLDSLGIVRVDVLGLGILTAIRKGFEAVQETYEQTLALATLPVEEGVYKMIGRADTIGVFQIESRAQMNMLPRLRPKEFYDLVIEVAIVRPGPIQGDMVHPYLRRRLGLEPTEYAHPLLEKILKRTFGVPLFQEQILKMAMTVAGFSGGEADELRRALGAWRRDGGERLEALSARFYEGLVARGVPADFANRILAQIQGFAEYGFPESHAASFAVLVYASAYLKHRYPDAFLAALLNAQPMGFYGPDSLIYDGMRHGVRVLGVCIDKSTWDSRLEAPGRVRLGFREVRGFREAIAESIVAARRNGPFLDCEDFVRRVAHAHRGAGHGMLPRKELCKLAMANAFQTLGVERRTALWSLYGASSDTPELDAEEEPSSGALPDEGAWERIALDYEAQGVALGGHPMAYLRAALDRRAILSSQALRFRRDGERVTVSGIVICRQMPETARGTIFLTLEDEYGFSNLVVWAQVLEQYKEPLLRETLLVCRGRLQRSDKSYGPGELAGLGKETPVLQVLVEEAEPLSLRELVPSESPHAFAANPSHDFR